MKRGLLWTAVLVLVGVVTFRWWLPTERVIAPSISLPDTRLDYSLQGFTAQLHDEAGQPDLRVSGPRLEHDAESRRVTITRPEFEFSTNQAPWLGRSRLAEFDRDLDSLLLIDEVEVWREQPQGRVTLLTERLQHQRPARTISADVPVMLTRPGTRVDTGGLMIQLDSETVNLSNEVHVHAQTANRRD